MTHIYRNPNIKYLLVPGHVTSKTDGDLHYISASRLAELYGVRMNECTVYPDNPRQRTLVHPWEHYGLIQLTARYDGDYSLPPRPPGKFKRGDVVFHKKSGNLYVIVSGPDSGVLDERTCMPVYAYAELDGGRSWVRIGPEMDDGRFEYRTNVDLDALPKVV